MSKLILIIGCFILVVLFGFFLIWPKYQKLSTLRLEIENGETELKNTEEYFAELTQLSQELLQYESQLSKIDFALPADSSSTVISLINFIQKASSQNGLILKKLKSFSIILAKPSVPTPDSSQTQPSSKVKEISLDFDISGSYFALKNFLNALEKSAKIIEVENVSFSVEKEEIPAFGLKIKTYSY
jgi:Tfp pilus assembly protein PilO